MKKTLLLFIACCMDIASHAQNISFQNYFQGGVYMFQDTLKIQKSEIFTTYSSQFGFSANSPSSMVFQAETTTDSMGGVSDRYIQYQNGYPVEGTMMNAISKYGIVLIVDGFSLPTINVNVTNPISDSVALGDALQYIGAPQYNWQDSAQEANIKISYDTSGNEMYDSSATLYPKGELVIAKPYGDTSQYDTSQYKLCWKFYITPMYWDTIVIDTNTVDSVLSLDTIVGYHNSTNIIVYVNAQTGQIYTTDSNIKRSFWVSYGVNHTWYEGNQNVQANTCTICSEYTLIDSRNLYLANGNSGPSSVVKTRSDHYIGTGDDGFSDYWELEATWDYFYDNYGLNGPNGHRGRLMINNPDDMLSYPNLNFYQYDPTFGDCFNIGEINWFSPSAISGAQLDLTAHEYTHAIMHYTCNLNNTGEPAAIAEGLCDYFGALVGWLVYPSRYTSDWSSGFGWQTGQYARHFGDPTTDSPVPSSASYGDSYWTTSNPYIESGVFRHMLALHTWGGTFNGIPVEATPSIQLDFYRIMTGYFTSSTNYSAARTESLAEYQVYYGKCSARWISLMQAWSAVGVGAFGGCERTRRIVGPMVIVDNQIGSNVAQFNILAVNDDPEILPALQYNWVLPQSWSINYSKDQSSITLMSTTDYSSQMVTCYVTNADSTIDTLTTFVHFVDSSSGSRMVNPQNSQTISADGLKLYPNPVNGLLNVILPFQPAGNIAFSLVDITGRELYSTVLTVTANVVSLPYLTPGIYIVKIDGEGKDYVRKITVE